MKNVKRMFNALAKSYKAFGSAAWFNAVDEFIDEGLSNEQFRTRAVYYAVNVLGSSTDMVRIVAANVISKELA